MAALAVIALPASAETWVNVPAARGAAGFHYDSDSVKQVGLYEVAVTWHDPPFTETSAYLVWSSVVDCAARSVVAKEMSVFNPIDRKPLEARPPSRPVTGESQKKRFPSASRSDGRLIRTVCADMVGADDAPLRALATSRRADWKCASTQPMVPRVWCRDDDAITDALALTLLRLGQASIACGTSWSDLRTLILSIVFEQSSEPRKCDQDALCSASSMNRLADDMGADLSNGESGKTCQNIASRLGYLRDQRARDDAIQGFWQCVRKQANALDDGVSPANEIALGVFGACRGALVTPGHFSLADNPMIQDSVMPRIVTEVLTERANKRSPAGARKPKKPAPSV